MTDPWPDKRYQFLIDKFYLRYPETPHKCKWTVESARQRFLFMDPDNRSAIFDYILYTEAPPPVKAK